MKKRHISLYISIQAWNIARFIHLFQDQCIGEMEDSYSNHSQQYSRLPSCTINCTRVQPRVCHKKVCGFFFKKKFVFFFQKKFVFFEKKKFVFFSKKVCVFRKKSLCFFLQKSLCFYWWPLRGSVPFTILYYL
jgi:hypothetical protein